MAFELAQSGDAAAYLTEAQSMAQDAQLDFLEIVGTDGNVVSSAQWPARFGYPVSYTHLYAPIQAFNRPNTLGTMCRMRRDRSSADRRSCFFF